MIDIELLRKNPELFRQNVKNRNYNPAIVDHFLKLDEEWRTLTTKTEQLRAEQKKLGVERKIDEAKKLKVEIEELSGKLATLESERLAAARKIPNLSRDWVPVGKSDADNHVALKWPEKPTAPVDQPKEYTELATKLGIIDTERAAKVSGSRFGYLLGDGARLEFALVQYAFDTLIKEGFTPVVPPVMIKHEMMAGMGYVERGGDEIYNLEKDGLYLVGTSEQSVGAMHADETFNETDLPRRYVAFSTCFRREAGSYGKDTKGILRVHQFDKVEMFSITTPERSDEEHKFLRSLEERFMQELELPYQVLDICTADLGDPAAAKWDIEAWLPGQNEGKGQYRETHSTSNTTDFQSRRLGVRYRTADSKSHLVHMLNGTAFAIGRMLIAIIENYQTKEGTVKVPKVLQKYVGITEIIPPLQKEVA